MYYMYYVYYLYYILINPDIKNMLAYMYISKRASGPRLKFPVVTGGQLDTSGFRQISNMNKGWTIGNISMEFLVPL